ncbi:hypothetical protein Tco_0850041 [Tanacetum coccineum]
MKIMAVSSKERPPMLASENKKLIDAEVEAVHMILNEIGNDIYSIVDACPNAKEMWIAIERLQQGECLVSQQHQNEVNEIRAERMVGNVNPLALLNKGKKIIKPPSAPSESASKEDKQKMMLCKKESKGIPLSLEQNERLQDTDEESDKQELEAHYMYLAKI